MRIPESWEADLGYKWRSKFRKLPMQAAEKPATSRKRPDQFLPACPRLCRHQIVATGPAKSCSLFEVTAGFGCYCTRKHSACELVLSTFLLTGA